LPSLALLIVTLDSRGNLRERGKPCLCGEASSAFAGLEGNAFNANYMVLDNVMVFARGGWSDGWVTDENFTAGFGSRPRIEYSDYCDHAPQDWLTLRLVIASGPESSHFQLHVRSGARSRREASRSHSPEGSLLCTQKLT